MSLSDELGTDGGDIWQVEALINFSNKIKEDTDDDREAVEQVIQEDFAVPSLGTG